MKWLGVMLQPFSAVEVATIRFHHSSGTVLASVKAWR
jgi:hypothetical protein